MSDKILRESLDRIREIEESDDPFCIGNIAEDLADTESLQDLEDGIEELQEIQQAYAHLNERLADAIRGYAPDSYSYWRSYGLAQLAIITQGENSGFASNDKSIDSLISDLEDAHQEVSAMQDEHDDDHGMDIDDEFEETVDNGLPLKGRY